LLAGDLKRFATGGQDVQLRARSQQLFRELGTGINQVLAVINDQEEALRPQYVND
jgi:hypothetical protein